MVSCGREEWGKEDTRPKRGSGGRETGTAACHRMDHRAPAPGVRGRNSNAGKSLMTTLCRARCCVMLCTASCKTPEGLVRLALAHTSTRQQRALTTISAWGSRAGPKAPKTCRCSSAWHFLWTTPCITSRSSCFCAWCLCPLSGPVS